MLRILSLPLPFQEWQDSSEIMQAYTVGKLEAGAAMELLHNVPDEICATLARLVKCHGV